MSTSNIPFEDFGGSGDVIHIAHANGFPAGTYKQLAQNLISDYHVIGMNARPLWIDEDYRKVKSWYTLAKDLIRFLDEKQLSNIIGVGHSFGSIITIIAANRRPDLFSKLVLVEPAILPINLQRVVSIAPVPVLKRIAPIIRTAGNRTDLWESQKEVFAHFRIKKVFKHISDEILWDYVRSVITATETGKVKLAYSKEWEAHIFATVVNPWTQIKKLKLPYLTIRAQYSDAFGGKEWDKWKAFGKQNMFIEMPDVGHLVPFEKPDLVAEHILHFLKNEK